MRTNMQRTSLDAYWSIGNLSPRQAVVYGALRHLGPACNAAIADYLDKPVNEVVPRVFELREAGRVKEAYRDIWPATGKRVIFWEAAE